MKVNNKFIPAIVFCFASSLITAQTTDDIDILELAKTGSLQDIQAALHQGVDVNAMDAGGQTPLRYAAENNQPSR